MQNQNKSSNKKIHDDIYRMIYDSAYWSNLLPTLSFANELMERRFLRRIHEKYHEKVGSD